MHQREEEGEEPEEGVLELTSGKYGVASLAPPEGRKEGRKEGEETCEVTTRMIKKCHEHERAHEQNKRAMALKTSVQLGL